MSATLKLSGALGAAALTGAVIAGSTTDTDLQARLDSAEVLLDELAAQQNADWMSEARSEQVRGIVQDVLADADTRASLQGSAATSGYNDGFFIRSSDGKWSMKMNGLFQERWNLGHQGASTVSQAAPLLPATINGTYNTAFGFETTRAALNFSGELAGVAFYDARLNWSPYNANNVNNLGLRAGAANGISNDPLEWAYGGWHMDDTWSIQVGRQKFDVMRGFMVNAEDQQAIERSSQTYYWNTSSITNGIKAVGTSDTMRGNVMFSNGSGAGVGNNTWTQNQHGWAVTGRCEWLLEGAWNQFDEIGSTVGGADGWLWGVGGGYLRNQDQSQNNWLISTDLSYQANGWNAYGSVTTGNNDNGVGDIYSTAIAVPGLFPNNDGTSIGFEVGAGMYLDDTNELYARWQWLSPGGAYGGIFQDPRTSLGPGGIVPFGSSYNPSSKLNMFTIGWNNYIAGPNAKLSVDWSWAFTDPSTANTLGAGAWGYTGWWNNTDTAAMTAGSMWLLRTQLQISF